LSVVVIGLNHRTAPLDVLERMTVNDEDLPKVLHDVGTRTHISEAVVLSTCNRIEIYAVAERFHGGYHDLREVLGGVSAMAPEEFNDHLYVHHDEAAVGHLFTVASGLDSAVFGESEILGQVGDAWEEAKDRGAAGSTLNLVFRHALEVGKRVRSETGVGRGVTSVSRAAVAMAADRLGGLATRKVLLVGAGDVGEGMAASLAAAGVADLLVANRTHATAVALARRVGGRAVGLGALAEHLTEVDAVLTSTGAPSVLIDHGDLVSAVERRRDRPILIVDVAVPRDVDPSARDVPGVTLLDMDDLRSFTDAGVESRRREAGRARRIIDEEIDRYRDAATARGVAPLVAALRDRAEGFRRLELERLASRLAHLQPGDREAIDAATRAMLAKLLHEPTVRLKGAAGTARGDRLAESLRDLFDL
jgi:glutamyl-tRNA reductase